MTELHVTNRGIFMSVNTEGLLESVRSLPNDQLQEFAEQVLRLNASRRSPSLSTSETEALKEIHRPLPADIVARTGNLWGNATPERWRPTNIANCVH